MGASDDHGMHGPSYWDAERVLGDITARFGGTAWWEVSAVKVKGADAYKWSVKACWLRPRATLAEAPQGATVGFRGTGEAKSMPAAMWKAGFDLICRLEDAKERAEQQSAF